MITLLTDVKDIPVPKGTYLMADGKHYMVRARHAGAGITLEQLKAIRCIAGERHLPQVRIDARENIQFYNIELEQVDGLKAELDAIGMPAEGKLSDICVNPDTGLASGEAFDVAPYAELLGHWLSTSPAALSMPGKFKMSLSSTAADAAHSSYADLAFFACLRPDGSPAFSVMGGGSLGAMPRLAIALDEVAAEDFLFAAEAMAETFSAVFEGSKVHKKRLRFKMRELGEDGIRALYKEKRAQVSTRALRTALPTNAEKARPWAQQAEALPQHPAIHPTRIPGIASLALHTVNGNLTRAQMDALIDALDGLPHETELALDGMHGIWLRDLSEREAVALLEKLQPVFGNQKRSLMASCAGRGVCRFGLAHTSGLLSIIRTCAVDDLPDIHISGCMNSCGRHQIAALGFDGRKPGDTVRDDLFEVYVGGRLLDGDVARIAQSVGKMRAGDVPDFLRRLSAMKAADNPAANWSDWLLNHKGDVAAVIGELEAE